MNIRSKRHRAFMRHLLCMRTPVRFGVTDGAIDVTSVAVGKASDICRGVRELLLCVPKTLSALMGWQNRLLNLLMVRWCIGTSCLQEKCENLLLTPFRPVPQVSCFLNLDLILSWRYRHLEGDARGHGAGAWESHFYCSLGPQPGSRD
jgi:hypothetical protein